MVAASATHAPFDTKIHDAAGRALGNPVRIRPIARRLISNAAQYGGQQVEIRTSRCGERVTSAVVDQDRAFPPDMDVTPSTHFTAHAPMTARPAGLLSPTISQDSWEAT